MAPAPVFESPAGQPVRLPSTRSTDGSSRALAAQTTAPLEPGARAAWAMGKPPPRVQGKKNRVHLVRNPVVCVQCHRVWEENDAEIKKLMTRRRADGSLLPMTHRSSGCGGLMVRYYDMSRDALARFARERIVGDASYATFFPVMGDLSRPDDKQGDGHHNTRCTGTCCRHGGGVSLGPEPGEGAEVRTFLSEAAFVGWEEQIGKTCAAASVAGAVNGVFFSRPRPAEAGGGQGEEGGSAASFESGGSSSSLLSGAGSSTSAESATSTAVPDKVAPRVQERDVLDAYCSWAKETGRLFALAALRGSCGLIPSTRKIGNYRWTMACHDVSKSHFGIAPAGEAQAAAAASGGSDEDDEEEEEGGVPQGGVSPVETERLLANWQLREGVAEGGRVAPQDEAEGGDGGARAEEEDAQWALLNEALRGGGSLLLHSRNHYSGIFGVREWACQATGAVRRQVLTATQKQRPHVWYCFRQLRADIAYSRVNQVVHVRRARGGAGDAFRIECGHGGAGGAGGALPPKPGSAPMVQSAANPRQSGGVLPRIGGGTPRVAGGGGGGLSCRDEDRRRSLATQGARGVWMYKRIVQSAA